MICYFGRDDRGHYADSEDGSRQYMTEELWRQFVEAGAHAGANVTGQRMKLRITEQITVEKYEGDRLIETVSGIPETTTL